MKPISLRRVRGMGAIMLAVFLFAGQSCYHYRVMAPNFDPATEYQDKTLHSFCWGLVQPKDLRPLNCEKSNGIDEVYISTNLGYTLLTIATLGIWSPLKVKWKCSKPCQRVGGF